MKTKILGVEPYLTILSSWKLLEDFTLNSSSFIEVLREEINRRYPNELTYYFDFLIKEGIKDSSFEELVKKSLEQIDSLLFDNNLKIKNFQLYKLLSLWILKELLVLWHLNQKNISVNNFRNCYTYNLPRYIRNLRDTHLHAGLAFDFFSLIEILTKNLEEYKKIGFRLLRRNTNIPKRRFLKVYERLKFQYELYKALQCRKHKKLTSKEVKALIFRLKKGIPLPNHSWTGDFSLWDFLNLIIKGLNDDNEDIRFAAAVSIVNLNSLLQENTDRSAYLGLQYFSDEFLKKNPIKRIGNLLSKNLLFKAYKDYFSKEEEVRGFELRMFPMEKSLKVWNSFLENLKDINKEFSLIFHFAKAPSWQSFEKIDRYYKNIYRICRKFCSFLRGNPKLARRVSGIDAASKEYWTPPWAFAPLYSFWRNYAIYYIPALKDRDEPIKFTFHAGEDFIELSAGLKSIYEALFFLELQSGDRIGHGLALAVEPESYSLRFRNVKVSYLYYFFTLLWLNYLTFKHPKMENYREFILMEIEEIANKVEAINLFLKELQRIVGGFNLHTHLVKVYQSLKFDFVNFGENDYFFELWTLPYRNEEFFQVCAPYIKELFRKYREEKKYKELYTFVDPLFRKEAPIPFEEQIEVLRKIREVIIEELIRRGVVVEACPSSNLLIRGLLDYKEHLVVKLKDLIKSRKLRVSLNTDDPLTFNTTLVEEYMLINEALPEEDREVVIRSLIETGNTFKFG